MLSSRMHARANVCRYVDQMAETGHELAIIGFGAKGWCGMCDAQLTNASFKAWMRGEVAYATSKGIGLSAYTLMQHNGWGEVTPKAEQTLNRDGTRGPTACFATDYHAQCVATRRRSRVDTPRFHRPRALPRQP